jgi:hypothetical protein
MQDVNTGTRTCGVPGCGKRLNSDNRIGFCRSHKTIKSRPEPRRCAVGDCGRLLHPRSTSGFCPVHAVRHTPAAIKREANRAAEAEKRRAQWRECTADGCAKRLRPDNKSGRCWKHKYAPVSAAEREQCSIEGCGKRLSPKNTIGRCAEHKHPRWVAAECAAEGCTKKLNVTNLIGFCGQHTNGYRRDYRLQHDYGITAKEYDATLVAQGGCCALCGKPPMPDGKRAMSKLHVDHDHVTGRVRSLLCGNCNFGIGSFFEDPGLMRRAADYVEQFAQLAA